MKDAIEIENLVVEAILGTKESEQTRSQPVRVDLRFTLPLEAAAGGDLGLTVDYGGVSDAVSFLVGHARVRLSESLAFAIARLVLAPPAPAEHRPGVEHVSVRVRKPTALGGPVPGVHVERPADWCDLGTRLIPDKTWVDTLVDTPQGGAWRLHVEPGSAWKVPPTVAVMVLAGSIVVDGEARKAGSRFARGELAEVLAGGDVPATLLVVGAPAL